jgi:type II secretory pathway component PulK
VADESARVNINYAPPLVLRAMGLSEATVDALVAYRRNGARQLASVDALLTRELIDAQGYDRIDTNLLTVYSVSDRRQPHSYINVNSASPRVLSAIFAINLDEARALAGKRPFRDWRDVLQKVGREPTSFNVEVPQFAPRDMPRALALSSRCFRLRSEVVLDMPGQDGRSARAGVEAVVYFHEDGSHAIRYWSPRGFIEEVKPSTPEDAAA